MSKIPFQNIEADEAQKLIDQNEVLVVDVRQPYEFKTGHIPNAQLVPIQSLYDFSEALKDQAIPKEQPILFVCAAGQRSAAASEVAAIMGYDKIYNLVGGMGYWSQAGLPVEK